MGTEQCQEKKETEDKHTIKPEDFGHIVSDTTLLYPRCPKINTYIESNRTIQEEFIGNKDIIHDKPLFNQRLAEYLVFYNTIRPHKSLGLTSPIEYLIENGVMSQKSLTYTTS